MTNGEISTQRKNQKIRQWKMNVRHSLFRSEVPDQVFPHALRSIASTRTSPTRTRWRDVIKGNPRTSFQVREALEAKERGEELSSSAVIVRKEEKGKRRAKAKAVEKDLDVAKAKGAKEKWAKGRMENRPSTKEAHLSVTFAWK